MVSRKRRTRAELVDANESKRCRVVRALVAALLGAAEGVVIYVRWAQGAGYRNDLAGPMKLTGMCEGWDNDEARLAAVKDVISLRRRMPALGSLGLGIT